MDRNEAPEITVLRKRRFSRLVKPMQLEGEIRAGKKSPEKGGAVAQIGDGMRRYRPEPSLREPGRAENHIARRFQPVHHEIAWRGGPVAVPMFGIITGGSSKERGFVRAPRYRELILDGETRDPAEVEDQQR